MQSAYIIASVDRALEVLLLLGGSSSAMGVTELSKALGVHKSTVHSILQTLLARGFVEQHENGRYSLGVKLMQLGLLCAERLDIRKAAKPTMSELAQQTEKVVLLATLCREELLIVETVEPENTFLIIPKFDFSVAVHSTAVGKVLLAYQSADFVEKLVSRGLRCYTPFTLVDKALLEQELARIRLQEYAIGCNETIDGLTCIAVPVFNDKGNVVAALSVSGSSSLIAPDKYEEFILLLKQKALLISQRMGYKN